VNESQEDTPRTGADVGPETVEFLPPDSDQLPVLSVVIPTLNEEGGIRPTLDRVREGVAALGVPAEVIVCDSSTDRTPDIAREEGATVVSPTKRGYGAAYKYGFAHARGEYIAIGDADSSYDFAELPKLFALVEDGADMALGSRFAGTIEEGAMPWLHQYVGNPVLTAFLNLFYDTDVTDSHSGFRVIRTDALERLRLRSDGMEFASEMIMQAGAIGLDVREAPITYHPRIGEPKLETFSDGWRHVKFMLVNAPGYLFSLPGILLGLVGLVVLLAAQFGVGPVAATPLPLTVASLLIVVGYVSASFGVFSGLVTTPIRKPRDPVSRWVERNFNLEAGVFVGATAFGCSLLALGVSLVGAVAGAGNASFTPVTVLAVTVVALSLVIVLEAFFFATLVQNRSFDLAEEGLGGVRESHSPGDD
jgi:hypothetical protein